MKATLEIPDELYAMVKARAALEGRTLRSVAIELLSQWVSGTGFSPNVEEGKPVYAADEAGRPKYDWVAIRQAIEASTGKAGQQKVSSKPRDLRRGEMEGWARDDEEDMRALGEDQPPEKP